MEEKTTGIILRTRLLTETSLIVHWLTPEWGRLATVAKGARRPKSPFRGKLDLFHVAEFSFVRSRRSELHTLREAVLSEAHAALRRDLALLQQASYCAALIEQTTEADTPLPGLFELFRGVLRRLPSGPPEPLPILAFELKLLHELGQSPAAEATRLTAGTKRILVALTSQDWPALARLRLSAAQAHELQRFLGGFLNFHLGKVLPGRDAALLHEPPHPSPRPSPL